ncbi:uncharacterized protein LOC123706064 [Colias croceus]|uniref:uncharacterized protein LOC123706064 n=1 Tax=Colias crocea TaxID=72248 RepID=UPI001E27A199|nr:uncharacterized protein LOC123706064 [Colias croceus]
MSKPGPSIPSVRVEPNTFYRQSQGAKTVDFVYVNSAYVGSVDDVNQSRLQQPPTTVIREQYWACSKWPFGQRVLAITVGVLLGAVISLTVYVVLNGEDKDIVNILRTIPAPD